MSDASANSLSREKIQQLLAAVGSGPKEDTTQTEAAEYDWQQPHYFSSAQLKRLDDLTKEAAKEMAEKFAKFCNDEFDVTVVSTTEHFAAQLRARDLESRRANYYLPFGSAPDHPDGLISIPAQTAFIWATQLLGDSESEEDSGRDLSKLEESLLLDIASALLDAFSGSCETCDFQPDESFITRPLPLELQGTEALCKITFQVRKSDGGKSSEAHILILCDKLRTTLGQTVQAVNRSSAGDTSKAILDRMQQMPVSVKAQLASAVLTFEEIMNLRHNDILLLGKRIDEPIDLIVDNRVICHGWPAKSDGRYAVIITEDAEHYE
ncbi:MAG: FliM/FliN family flagellar motor switch protein [Phycisphaerae bacterium]|nr:FliM/FliN family flagellar motor switch protein [Phycisphaerae bacterium]